MLRTEKKCRMCLHAALYAALFVYHVSLFEIQLVLEDPAREEEQRYTQQQLRHDRAARHARGETGALYDPLAVGKLDAKVRVHKPAEEIPRDSALHGEAEQEVQHDVDADVGQDRPQHAVLLRQMAERDRGIDLQRLGRNADEGEHDTLHDQPGQGRGRARHTPRSARAGRREARPGQAPRGASASCLPALPAPRSRAAACRWLRQRGRRAAPGSVRRASLRRYAPKPRPAA